MSKFFVGQRVRVIDCEDPCIEGEEARIIGESIYEGVDCWDVEAIGRNDLYCEKWEADWILEPILPEGSAPSEFTFQQLMDSLQEVMA
jgi:hypothetical protein